MTKTVILLVEDEAIIRLDAAAMMEDAGYEVIEAGNADEAILFLEARPDIRIVFSDIEMPGSMDGIRLIHAVRERWPPVVLILASGRVAPLPHDLPAKTVFLQKPYSAEMLMRALAPAEDRAPPA
ncbi:MAG: response regulator [Bosea sp. (in: a-proteobacteria)]